MYVRTVKDQELSFIVSGKLWRDAMVMLDRETMTHWSHLTGHAFKGDLTGEELEFYASEMTTWSEWLAANPETRVLFKELEERGETKSPYEGYFDSPDRLGIFGREIEDHRLKPKDIVIAVETGDVSMAFLRDQLPRDRAVNTVLAETPIVIVPTPAGGFLAYDRRVGDSAPDLELSGGRLLGPNGQAWDVVTGKPAPDTAEDTPSLEPLRAHVVYWFGWVSFFPEALIWEGEKGE